VTAKETALMWIAKGISLGVAIFFFGGIGLAILSVVLGISKVETSHAAIGLSAVAAGVAETLYSPFFWLALLGCVFLGIAIVRFWPTVVRP
jgi:hypothetical protein